MSEQPGQGDGGTGPTAGQDTAPAGGPGRRDPGQPDRAGLRALWLGGGSILLMPLFFPIGLALAVAALVVGVKARKRSRQDRSPAQGATAGIVLGAIGSVMGLVWLVFTAALYPETARYQDCLQGANTNSDEKVCRDAYTSEVEKKFNLPEGSMSRYDGWL
ncbi:hypothetical protein [Actinomadura sp. 21ATH]|uniref:hypothetical protein n=1 Tax=Actinomadura sp. 21ATH TaxID=1735444 RepID=UPI0035BEBCDC